MSAPKGFAWRRATGLYYSGGRLTVAWTSLELSGRRTFSERTIEVEPEKLGEAVETLHTEGALKGAVVCSLDLRSLISITRQLNDVDLARGGPELLKEHVGSAHGGLATGAVPVKVGTRHLTSLYAFPHEPVAAFLHGLGTRRASQRHMTPLPLALAPQLRDKASGKPRRWGTWVSVLAGPGYGVALLMSGKRPLAMRLFPCRLGVPSASAMESAALGLASFARDELALARLDGILLHTGDDEEVEAHADELERVGGWEVVIGKRLPMDDGALARALATHGMGEMTFDPDLFEELVEVTSAWDNVPVRQLIGVGVAIVLSALSIFWQAMTTETDASLVTGRAEALAAQAGVKLKGLADEQTKLKKEVRLASAFAENRLFWEDYLQEVPRLLPETMHLVRLDARNRTRWSEKSAAETRLSITAEVPLAFIDGTPPEVTDFTEAIQTSELFREELPRIRGSNVRFQSGLRDSRAKLVLQCSPR